ncbi:hypothetical protein HPB51_013879 [Rhipicephalus microplus]|uniref:Tick transposon n=1 Tax=Rhipicephalus microplus TaxID=6941 RepID=A0A9J6F1U2_RHIMP|nr:hypothetical protein HPB51_014438 [Rhipicephalus microplus]KAH8023692.1 hypothetical protein HPB51_015232 [Rhipicephalus microplus]KAH8029370.1 hypothetical protein HPB51_025582 [Rhipicephalus microplus]KAH8040096.1 hypothetical protein HPB51_009352 [Rhipicephalus microplus]KAH8041219.1 hypothetical protein HPB51_013879 [Rhipicephalus microplus]
MSAGTGRDAAGVDGARSWRAIHESLSRQRQHPSSPPSHAVAQERQSRAAPKPPPLPRSDYKIILRVRGGLNCAVIHPCVLRQIILKAAGLPISDRTSSDQIRVNSINHTVLISTPDLDRADLYHGIRLLNFNGTPHEVATHVADPVDTCRGTVLLPSDYSEDEIISTLRRCNPKLTIGGARRLGSTETILIIFQGKIVPYYVHYDGCALRCRPFRQKVEACTRCRQIGHRQDVCTNTSDTLCPKCGLKDAPMDHECDHVCVVCNGNHETGSSLCRQRFKPRPTRSMEKQDPPIHRSPSREQTHGSSQRKSRSKSKERGRKSRSKSKERGRRSSASKSKDRGRRSDSTTQDDAWPGLSPSPALNNSSVNSHQVAAAASVLASSSEEAEEAAIALALTIPSSSVIITDLNHIMWRCPKHPLPPFLKRLISSEEQWEAALRSSRPAIQEAILEWAERVEEDYFK